ncbi:MAG TPA: tRNA-(ms[2]io[6]A)-hydroxylase [Chitinophagales bacterium]|nr:tRNA-(ms[2]io[6]A)-hydroxylase [Chitinophagales bacterium]
MKKETEITLSVCTSPRWVEAVMGDFDSFLQDHANCERKASAMAMSFVAKYPDRKKIIPALITTALEELKHFQQVYRIMEKRGVPLVHEIPEDLYIKQLIQLSRNGRDERLLDRLLIAAIVECRGAERFQIMHEALEDDRLKDFYRRLYESEINHGNVFLEMARNYFDEPVIQRRLAQLVFEEGKILNGLKLRAALH